MEGTDLKPKTKPVYLKVLYIFIFFAIVFLFVFYLYGYLWQKFTTVVGRTLSRDFYIEATDTSCNVNADCNGACGTIKSSANACLCLSSVCQRVENVIHFDQTKFCESDNDCVVSCYEGPVGKSYYESVNAERVDCMEGCKSVSFVGPDGEPNPAVCKNRQCQYDDGQTCFISSIPSS